eukprot:TRINITY_DN6624_c0_g2_i2.p1 TRINITY_DN6624_c0_g2~~TRINITY_DN6624_c0_g2_i2.p1  ORF type:complete len:617 (-),score=96.21 TRINITY_DN6624_c0_g2_i2:185-2035(-)
MVPNSHTILPFSLLPSQTVKNGPGVVFIAPLKDSTKRKAQVLGPLDYALTENTVTGELGRVLGPTMYYPGPYDKFTLHQAKALHHNEYVRVIDQITGNIRIECGEMLFHLQPTEKLDGGKKNAFELGPFQYIRVEDTLTGQLRNVLGPKLWFPGPYDKFGSVKNAISLKHNEYVKIEDQLTGGIRVEVGESLVYLSPTEKVMGDGVKTGVEVDEETAVVVRNTKEGQLRLVTNRGLFIPGPEEEIEEIRELIKLADYETVIIMDREGRYTFRSGNGSQEERAFFLPVYSTLVELEWSCGIRMETQDLKITKIDSRPQFMSYEMLVRSKDNVELLVQLTFLWEVVDVPTLIRFTDDAPGDICHHARSAVIDQIGQVTLEHFMQNFGTLVNDCVLGRKDDFYLSRGVKVHTVEVRSMHCKDPSTERVLQQIIQESTNRLNRLQIQESENEVKLFRLKGDIEEERLKGELLEIQHSHIRAEALMQGEAEADRVKAFLSGVSSVAEDPGTAIQLFNTIKRLETLETVSNSGAHLYFTPADVNLSIETFEAPPRPGQYASGKGPKSQSKGMMKHELAMSSLPSMYNNNTTDGAQVPDLERTDRKKKKKHDQGVDIPRLTEI